MFVDLLPTVYEEGGALLAHDTDELVHDAAGHPRVRVLRPLTRQRLLLVRLCPAARQLLQEGVEGHLINNDNNNDNKDKTQGFRVELQVSGGRGNRLRTRQGLGRQG